MKRILAPFVGLALVAAFVTCGDDETGSQGGQGAQGATGAQGGGGGTGGDVGGTGGTGGSLNCTNDGMCTPMTEDCACTDCIDAPECGACVDDMMCTLDDACTCAECLGDFLCGCREDNYCDQFLEDCACADCANASNCMGQVENCNNNMDDNGNMLVDCDDLLFCFDEMQCQEDCTNTTDDNDNGLTDCDDGVYCQNDMTCASDACGLATAINVGTTMGDTTGGTVGLGGGCQFPGGKEVVYTYTPPMGNGFLGITLQSAADLGVYIRTDCADDATEIACGDSMLGGSDEVFVIDVDGTPLTLVVDGYEASEAGPFTLILTYAADGGCIDDMQCSAQLGEGCQCTDCAMELVCGSCNVNMMCDPADDACTCDDCDLDMFCTDPTNCIDDQFCDQYNEGCQCADCAAVPNCTN